MSDGASVSPGSVGSKSAFLFSGQGQQVVGMGAALCQRFSLARETLEEADDVLGFSLSRIIAQGPAELLTETANAQPALLAVSIAYARVLAAQGLTPSVVAGHSLGEYSALVCAQSLRYADALRVVRRRGEAMQRAVPLGEGGMLAILGLDVHEVEEICRVVRAGGGLVEIAADNCPGNVVVSGRSVDLPELEALARDLDAMDVLSLAVSAPFHSSMLLPAARELGEVLADVPLAEPAMSFFANVTALPMVDPDRIRENLVRQVFMPLCWRQSLERLLPMVKRVVQVGPGRALLGHLKRLNRRFPALAVETATDLEALLREAAP